MSGRVRWKKIWVRTEQVDAIVDLLEEHPEHGYNSVSSFINDAVRSKLIELRDAS